MSIVYILFLKLVSNPPKGCQYKSPYKKLLESRKHYKKKLPIDRHTIPPNSKILMWKAIQTKQLAFLVKEFLEVYSGNFTICISYLSKWEKFPTPYTAHNMLQYFLKDQLLVPQP